MIPQKSIVIQALQVEQPHMLMNKGGRSTFHKAGDTRVEVVQQSPEGTRKIQWLEREWHSKKRMNNFMKAFHYTQRLELALRRPEYAICPEVVDRDLIRRVI
ncbi:MAG: hypothetical protein QHG99_07505 [Methanomicrobiales archaeon]|nr:hypothetical protein [Methanomicrobiales archaeon]